MPLRLKTGRPVFAPETGNSRLGFLASWWCPAALVRSASSASQAKAPRRQVWDDQALSRYPVLKIHATAAMHTIKKAIIMTRLTPALISEVP
jgi:hypothetical protein